MHRRHSECLAPSPSWPSLWDQPHVPATSGAFKQIFKVIFPEFFYTKEMLYMKFSRRKLFCTKWPMQTRLVCCVQLWHICLA